MIFLPSPLIQDPRQSEGNRSGEGEKIKEGKQRRGGKRKRGKQEKQQKETKEEKSKTKKEARKLTPCFVFFFFFFFFFLITTFLAKNAENLRSGSLLHPPPRGERTQCPRGTTSPSPEGAMPVYFNLHFCRPCGPRAYQAWLPTGGEGR